MILRAAAGLLLVILVGVTVGQVFPTLYAIPLSISVCLFISVLLQYWIMFGLKQGIIELIFDLPLCMVPSKLRMWAIWNDKDLM
jgi:hypothetical protein